MKPTRWIIGALALCTLTAAAAVCRAQDDPFVQMKTYDFQSRKPVTAIRQMIRESLSDSARLGEIEAKIDVLLEDPSASFAGKQEACRMLWEIGTARSVPILAKMLADDNMADMARYALERNADPAAGKALRAALTTATGRTLVGVINSIGDRSDPAAVGPLKKLAGDTDPLVSEAAVVALGKIGTDSAVAALRSLPNKNLTVYEALVRSGDRICAAGNKGRAAGIYASLIAPAVPAVAQADALRGLAAAAPARASAAAFASLKTGDPQVQIVAAKVYGSPATARSVRQIDGIWTQLTPPTQLTLLATLADHDVTAAEPLALKAIESPDQDLRVVAIHATARLGGANAVPRVAEIMTKGTEVDHIAARATLARLPGKEAEQTLLRLAKQGNNETRAAVLGILAERADAPAMAVLVEAAQGSDTYIAQAALKSLARVGGPNENAVLVKILVGTTDDNVRDTARSALVAGALRSGNRDQTAAPVLAALSGASSAGKAALLSSLAEIGGDRALSALIEAAGSSDAEVKRAAVSSLADVWSDSRPLPTLLFVAKSDSDKTTRVLALRGYLRLTGADDRSSVDDKVGRVREALAVAERVDEKRQALSVLRDARSEASVQLAAKSLDDAELFEDAANVVLFLAGPQKQGDKDVPAVKGAAVNAALDKIIQNAKDDALKSEAQKLKS